jgi:hypothetical protein
MGGVSAAESLPVEKLEMAYPVAVGRDLRIDFLRGMALVFMLIAHIEILSVFNLFTSERFGLISGAEWFVMLSGFVVGQVYRSRLQEEGWVTTIYRLYSRAWKLYVVSLFIILSFYLLSFVPVFDVFEMMHFTDRASGTVYPLYPEPLRSLSQALNSLFYLQAGPHQAQVLGLYVFLLFLTPLALAAFWFRHLYLFLGTSWLLYVVYQLTQFQVLNDNAERAFPILAWQLLYFHGLAAGWYRNEIASYMHGRIKFWTLTVSIFISLVCFFLAQNHSNPFLPDWARLHVISAETFSWLHASYAQKVSLGPLRVLNNFALIVSLYYVLTLFWRPFFRMFGWYLIPIGQYSLYVFIVHVYVVFIWSQFLTFDLSVHHWFSYTFAHAAALGLLWWMTRRKLGMSFIPT